MSITPPNVRSGVMALAPKYERLRGALESSAKKIEGGAKTARSEVADLQRQAIASLQECADIALRLAECLGDGACPRDITCLHLGDWNRCDVCFDEQVSRFFDQGGMSGRRPSVKGSSGAMGRSRVRSCLRPFGAGYDRPAGPDEKIRSVLSPYQFNALAFGACIPLSS